MFKGLQIPVHNLAFGTFVASFCKGVFLISRHFEFGEGLIFADRASVILLNPVVNTNCAIELFALMASRRIPRNAKTYSAHILRGLIRQSALLINSDY